MTAAASEPAADPALNRYALQRVRLDLREGPAVEIEMPAGARIVHSYTAYESATRLIARPGVAPPTVAIPMLVVVFDPRRPMTRRRFVAIAIGSGVDTDQVLEPVATFSNDAGEMFTLFEAVGAAPSYPPDTASGQVRP